MKRIISFISLLIFAFCNQSKTELQNIEASQVLLDTIGNEVSEINMKNQLKEYLVAFNGGDPDKALFYIYPDIFEYLLQKYPDEKITLQEIKNIMIEPVMKLKKVAQEKKVTYEFEIGEITKSVNYKSSKLCIVINYITTKVKLDKNSIGGEVIAISHDGGKNWKFAQYDPETTPGVLEMKFPNEIVNKFLSKNK